MTYAERVKQKADFLKVCRKYGFDEEDYQRSFKHFAKHGNRYTFLTLIGFTEGGRCILEVNNSMTHSKKQQREYLFPSECMRFMRLYYDDMAYKMREKREYETARTYDSLVKLMTKKMEKAGFNAHPTDIFNAYGSTENAKCSLGKNGKIALYQKLGQYKLADMGVW